MQLSWKTPLNTVGGIFCVRTILIQSLELTVLNLKPKESTQICSPHYVVSSQGRSRQARQGSWTLMCLGISRLSKMQMSAPYPRNSDEDALWNPCLESLSVKKLFNLKIKMQEACSRGNCRRQERWVRKDDSLRQDLWKTMHARGAEQGWARKGYLHFSFLHQLVDATVVRPRCLYYF